VYDVAQLGEKFDFVIFMGVLYHLRHPLLALDLLYEHVVGDLLLFQSMQRGSTEVDVPEINHHFWETELFDRPGWPKMFFVEHRYATTPPTGGCPTWPAPRPCCAAPASRSWSTPSRRSTSAAAAASSTTSPAPCTPPAADTRSASVRSEPSPHRLRSLACVAVFCR
jgi:hypothetical protein